VDFDGVIHGYSRGWQGGEIYDPPVPGALEALAKINEKYDVVIFTTRKTDGVLDWITAECLKADVPIPWPLHVTNTKPLARLYIDDRGYRFTDWPSALAVLDELAAK
jgi:hypothetical protein